jgi:hypothetical protein
MWCYPDVYPVVHRYKAEAIFAKYPIFAKYQVLLFGVQKEVMNDFSSLLRAQRLILSVPSGGRTFIHGWTLASAFFNRFVDETGNPHGVLQEKEGIYSD